MSMNNLSNISQGTFAARRRKLMDSLGEQSIAIVQAARLQTRNSDAEFPFRQDSDFLYLTGFNEPDAVAVFIPGRAAGEFVLFCLDKDPLAERWNGKRAGVEGARHDYGADEAYPLAELDKMILQLMDGRDEVHYRLGLDKTLDERMLLWLNRLRAQARNGVVPPSRFVVLDKVLHEMRLYKCPEEITLMQQSARIAAQAHTQAMQVCKPGMYEFEIEAEFLRTFRQSGMTPAYTSIVGGGENACILHYIENNAPLQDGDLLLIDAGAEHHAYASDITRTFPVNGRFSQEQRVLYEWVLKAQKAAIAAVKPGNTWDDPHQAALRVLVTGLVELGLLQGDVDALITAPEATYKQFFMHKTGHWLGMDVHDVGDYKVNGDWRVLEAGMVLTIEPGLYISPADNVEQRWWNIGIRIEDDVLVTEQGHQVLTADVVKEVDDIEALMASH